VGPFGLAALANGEVLVADGLSVAVLGAEGARRPYRLIVDLPTLVVGVAEVGGSWWLLGARGQVFRAVEGARPTPLFGRLEEPTSLAADGAGGALVVERAGGRVVRYGPDGDVLETIPGLAQPQAAAVTEDGTVWATTAAGLVGVRAGAVVATVGDLAGGEGVAVAGDDSVLVADPVGRRVRSYQPGTGRVDLVAADVAFGSPVADVRMPLAFAALAPDGAGGVLVGANGDGSIRRLVRQP
jgi:hypothetical protein